MPQREAGLSTCMPRIRPGQHDEVPSPCIAACELGTDTLCRGCLRTVGEIANWGAMDASERKRVLASLGRRRAAAVA